MDKKAALSKVREAADLIAMVEDLTNPQRSDSMSPASWSGMRVTLKLVREQLLASHRSLASGSTASIQSSVSVERDTGSQPSAGFEQGATVRKDQKRSLSTFIDS